jgi:hypothetical protein
MVREQYDLYLELTNFAIRNLSYEAAAVCEVEVELTISGETNSARMRWIRSDADGMGVAPNESGELQTINYVPKWYQSALSLAANRLKNSFISV